MGKRMATKEAKQGRSSIATGDDSVELPLSPISGFTADRKRWLILALFSSFSFCNATQWICYSPVVDEAKASFNMTSFQVNFLSMIFTIVYPLGSYATCHTLDRLGLKMNLIIGNVLNVMGAGLKVVAGFAAPSFGLLFVAQTINAIAQLFILSVPPFLAAQWFPSKERTLATSIAAMSNNIGVACALLLPPIIVGDQPGSSLPGFRRMFGLQLAISSLVLLATLPVPKKPHTPPSFAAKASSDAKARSSVQSHSVATGGSVNGVATSCDEASLLSDSGGEKGLLLQTKELLLRNGEFRITMLASGSGIGSMWAFSTVLAQLFQPFGVSEAVAGQAGFFSLIGGTVFAAVVGFMIDRHRVYKPPMIGLMITASGFLVMTFFALTTQSGAFSVIAYTLSGCAQNAALPVFFEYGLECTFPVPEAITSTLIMLASNALSCIFILVASAILGNNPNKHQATLVILILAGIVGAAGFSCFLLKNKLVRKEYEHTQACEEDAKRASTIRSTGA